MEFQSELSFTEERVVVPSWVRSGKLYGLSVLKSTTPRLELTRSAFKLIIVLPPEPERDEGETGTEV